MPQVICCSYGRSTPKRSPRGARQDVPVVVQRAVDVDGDAHGCQAGAGDATSVVATWRSRGPQIGEPTTSGRANPRPGSTSTGAPHQRWVPVDGRAVNAIEVGEGPRRRPRPRPERQLAELARGHPAARRRRRTASSRSTCPASAHSEMPAEPISIPGYARTIDAVSTRWASTGPPRSSAARWAASSPRRWRSRTPSASSASCSSPPPACGAEQAPRAAARRREQGGRVYAPLLVSRLGAPRAAAAAAQRGAAQRGAAQPGRISAPLAYELLSGAGKPGFIDALQALYDYRIRDRLPEIACPTLVVWGADDPMVPLAPRVRVRRPHPGRPRGRVRPHGARADARGARAVQRRAPRVPARRTRGAAASRVGGDRALRGARDQLGVLRQHAASRRGCRAPRRRRCARRSSRRRARRPCGGRRRRSTICRRRAPRRSARRAPPRGRCGRP